MPALEYTSLPKIVSPYEETLAYERLYATEGMTLKLLTQSTSLQGKLPSEAWEELVGLLPRDTSEVDGYVDSKIGSFGVMVRGTPSWPRQLDDSLRPSPLIYCRGNTNLLSQEVHRVAIVGSRKATTQGLGRAQRLALELSESGVIVVSGLAAGIDTAALSKAVNYRYGEGEYAPAIAVIGTPIDEYYPRENRDLQDWIAGNGLLLSQVPFYRYRVQPFRTRRYYFPERNELMAAVSDATVIVEASDTSGSLTQARACAHQGRPLFILRSCLENREIKWPRKWAERDGVHVISSTSELLETMGWR